MFNLTKRENRNVERPRPQDAWDPFRAMDALMRWDPFSDATGGLFRRTDAFLPRFDVLETKDGYRIHGDMPGVKEKDLNLSLTGNVLTIAGTREAEKVEETDQYYAVERGHGQFSRSFALPEGVDAEAIRADLKDGVLTLQLGKKPEVQARTIKIGKGEAKG
jgi:HSP20 family protein